MRAERWLAEQRRIREAVRARRRAAQDAGNSEAPDAAGLPLVSVVVVCYNAEKVLARCLEHLLAQNYPAFEIIVVDDGSDDGTCEAAAAFDRDCLKVIRHERNRGVSRARNLGIDRSNGEIVAFMDADGYASADWLSQLVPCFLADDSIGGVASTVFFESNPMVINGAGGTVNRQGWAADLSMNTSYEHEEIGLQALYAMGCGMALRRAAIERVGPFDSRMLNYYDDVDYGIRLWRAGYRVVVATGAWIDHAFCPGAESAQKRRLCERHRMRVVLKHAPIGTLWAWSRHEMRSLRHASAARRMVRLRAMRWNAMQLPGVLAERWRLRRCLPVPDRLVDPTWGDSFPAGVPVSLSPHPEKAGNQIAVAELASEAQLVHGWFPVEQAEGRSYRWAGEHAAVLMRLEAPARRLRLDYAHPPEDTGGVEVQIRRLGAADPIAPVWSAELAWQYVARSLENHPMSLPSGDYEVVFNTRVGWPEPPRGARRLGFALSNMSFHERVVAVPGGLDMASPAVEEQLVCGWFEPEQSARRVFRWATGRAAAIISLARSASCLRICYRFPPVPSAVDVALRPLDREAPVWSSRIAWEDRDWHEDRFPLELPAGEYLLTVQAETPWCNPGQRDPKLWAESRVLGVALSTVSFELA